MKNDVPGYERLAAVLDDAYAQAAKGKGAERHAYEGEAFHDQVMADMAKRFGMGALLGQAFKKSEESQRLPYDAARKELLGAINYLAGAVIHLDKRNPITTTASVSVSGGVYTGKLTPNASEEKRIVQNAQATRNVHPDIARGMQNAWAPGVLDGLIPGVQAGRIDPAQIDKQRRDD